MTGALMSAKTDEARTIILDNLQEEIRDAHPLMMRRFAIAAQAVPTDTDALAVMRDVTSMRLFIGRLQPIPTLTTMAFFEGFIQRFMQYLAELAQLQGSTEMEYTDVHGVCDIAHTAGLYKALQLEIDDAGGVPKDSELYEGVHGLRTLIQTIIAG
jgi:hypothetical protein